MGGGRWAVGVGRLAAVVALVLAVVVISLRMILYVHIVGFSYFMKRRNGHTDIHTYGRTDIRTDRPSYRDARTHLKKA